MTQWVAIRPFRGSVREKPLKLLIFLPVDFAFGESIRFDGPLHGAGPFIAMLVAMLVAEELFMRLYRRLA